LRFVITNFKTTLKPPLFTHNLTQQQLKSVTKSKHCT
jgi:hypothetical protein